ncbi:hypothetical protein JCM2811A_02340 [Methylorubrum rhodinum]
MVKAGCPMLKQSETRASKACCGRSADTASRTVFTNFCTPRAKIASHSAAVMRRPTRGVGGPAAAVWPTPMVQIPTLSL